MSGVADAGAGPPMRAVRDDTILDDVVSTAGADAVPRPGTTGEPAGGGEADGGSEPAGGIGSAETALTVSAAGPA